VYGIAVENPFGVSKGIAAVFLNGDGNGAPAASFNSGTVCGKREPSTHRDEVRLPDKGRVAGASAFTFFRVFRSFFILFSCPIEAKQGARPLYIV
jgi:hypothetical protein